jgi:3-phenylpropionate/trans-cinnamate dioxygenase ferredoxin reductase component
MDLRFRFLVIGAGPCGGRAASELARTAGPGQTALIGQEPLPPYERPPLSKAFLTEKEELPPAVLLSAERLAAAGVTSFFGDQAVALDTRSRRVILESGKTFYFERLLLATGARPRQLTIPGATLPGIHYLRSYSDAIALRRALRSGSRLAVVGGGYIGLEVAASASSLGLEVTVVETGEQLMGRSAPLKVAAAIEKMFMARSVKIMLGVKATAFIGKGRVEALLLDHGVRIPADLVLVGIGAEPNVHLASEAGLEVQDGIIVDAEGRTSNQNIFAAGDVANRFNPIFGVRHRLEAWEPALDRGAAVAAAMLDQPRGFERAPWVWSDQFDWNIQVLGVPSLADQEIFRGDPSSQSFLVLYLAANRLVGAVALNAGRDMALCRRALAQRMMVDAGKAAAWNMSLRDAFSG